ncbi:MAG: hypothetical protein ABJO88_00020 [Parasphingorhabdus sp.]
MPTTPASFPDLKMIADIIAVRPLFGLTDSETKMETICLVANRMDAVTFVTEAPEQVYNQTALFVYLRETVCENADRTVEINRRVLPANLRFRRYDLPKYDTSTAPFPLIVRMFKAEATDTML